ncbi:class I SAM-dependent methyltransferase [Mycolicibacterium sp. SCSIO 43805]|uniref:class I SAM-dependent methyltransferase n=1 Tax=Mycolicibacterium sp. SCSIO 43805 TaxID=3378074 RepID=UPI003AB7CA29
MLIDEENSVFQISDFVGNRGTYFAASATRGRWRDLLPSISTNLKANENYLAFGGLVSENCEAPCVLILGAGELGEGISELLKNTRITFVESDVDFGPRVKLILDGHRIPFRDGMFDGVIAQAVLEHVVDPYQVVKEIHRVLKADGFVYAETPFMQQVHGGRYDFTRFTHLGHRRLFRNFEECSSGAVSGTGMAFAWSYKYFLRSLTRRRTLQQALVAFGAFTSFFWKYFDRRTITRPETLDGASGLYFLGRKSSNTLSDKELIKLYRGAL